MKKTLVLVKGAGDLASGLALRLYRAGYAIVMTDISIPSMVRRTVSFGESIFNQNAMVENVQAVHSNIQDYLKVLEQDKIPVLTNVSQDDIEKINPRVLIDAIIAKKNTGTYKSEDYFCIGVGPGFNAPHDVDVVIESMRGHNMGRCIYDGSALPNTGIPGDVGGYTSQRVLRSQAEGSIFFTAQIGDVVQKDDVIGHILTENQDKLPIIATISGIIRGLLHNGNQVTRGYKIGDIDPRCAKEHCYTVSDKGLSIGGAALEALLQAGIYPYVH